MAQKPVNNFKSSPSPTAKPMAKPAASTDMRNSAVPPRSAAGGSPKKEIGYSEIAKRAYELWQSKGGSEMENWLAAERELRAK